MLRFIVPICLLLLSVTCQAAPVTIGFTAMIGGVDDIDTDGVFGEGQGANLSGQTIAGSVTIDPSLLTQVCMTGGACYTDSGAGAIAASFSLNGVTVSVVSTGTLGFAGDTSGGLVGIKDPADGGSNYVSAGASSPDGSVQETIGALFDHATAFSAFGGGDPVAAIDSLASIGGGQGLVAGGATVMTSDEQLEATILTIDVPEPPADWIFAFAVVLLDITRRRLAR